MFLVLRWEPAATSAHTAIKVTILNEGHKQKLYKGINLIHPVNLNGDNRPNVSVFQL